MHLQKLQQKRPKLFPKEGIYAHLSFVSAQIAWVGPVAAVKLSSRETHVEKGEGGGGGGGEGEVMPVLPPSFQVPSQPHPSADYPTTVGQVEKEL